MTLPPRKAFISKRRDSEAHKRFIRLYECAVWNNSFEPCDMDHKVECAHVRNAANSGTGLKPGPEWLVPLCRRHHHLQHQHGLYAFEKKYGIDLTALAREFASKSPDRNVREAAKAMKV